jgi:4-oxalocrotonate tautomerase
MPYVNVQITRGGVTVAQKKKLIFDITRSLVTTLGKKPEHIHIVIDEIDPRNWGFAGMLTTEYLARASGDLSAAPQRKPRKRGKAKAARMGDGTEQA